MRKRSADLAQALGSRAWSNAFVLCHRDLLQLAVGTFDLGRDGCNLVVEPASLLSGLGALEADGRVFVQLLPGQVEVAADVFAGPAHGLHAVVGLLALRQHIGVKGGLEAVALERHGLSAAGNADLDRVVADLMGHVGNGLESRRTESVHCAGASCVGEAGGQSSCA